MLGNSKSSVTWFFIVGAIATALLFVYNNYAHDKLQAELQIEEDRIETKAKMGTPPGTRAAFAETAPVGGSAGNASNLTNGSELEVTLQSLSASEKKQWQTFEEVIQSKNDNDPRVDRDLKHISEPLRTALKKKYDELPMENRNERGLVAFLISRDIKSSEDLIFLKEIYQEKPCLSLSNCQSEASSEDPHHSGMNQMTLNYPQMVPLYQIEQQLNENPHLIQDPVFKTRLRQLLDVASRFDSPSVQKKAEELRAKL